LQALVHLKHAQQPQFNTFSSLQFDSFAIAARVRVLIVRDGVRAKGMKKSSLIVSILIETLLKQ
jgi:hypothetical protein